MLSLKSDVNVSTVKAYIFLVGFLKTNHGKSRILSSKYGIGAKDPDLSQNATDPETMPKNVSFFLTKIYRTPSLFHEKVTEPCNRSTLLVDCRKISFTYDQFVYEY